MGDPNLDTAAKQPLDIAMFVSNLVVNALQKRKDTSAEDGMTFSISEQQTITGRIVGVTLRLPDLEQQLDEMCQAASWIAKYQEWHRFGVVDPDDDGSTSSYSTSIEKQLVEDPLLRMNRAESLLAVFLHTVEIPELAAKNKTVPDDSRIDFLDEDRREVLLVV